MPTSPRFRRRCFLRVCPNHSNFAEVPFHLKLYRVY
jgi:hypothetical protein